jgi:hypothetical protein
MHDDGYITVRYLNPDGTRFENELPEHLVFAAEPHPITALWDRQYMLGNQGRVMTHETLPNLLHLSEVDPLLFEELLVRLESCPKDESRLWSERLMTKIMHPTDHRPNESFAPVFRSMLRTVPIVSILGPGIADANTLISNARKTVKYLGHEHLAATAFCWWVMDDGTFSFKKLSYEKHQSDIEFIDANLEAVIGIRDALKRVKSFDREFVAELVGSSSALTDGAL